MPPPSERLIFKMLAWLRLWGGLSRQPCSPVSVRFCLRSSDQEAFNRRVRRGIAESAEVDHALPLLLWPSLRFLRRPDLHLDRAFRVPERTFHPRYSPSRSPRSGANLKAWCVEQVNCEMSSEIPLYPSLLAIPVQDSQAPDGAGTQACSWRVLFGSTGKHPGKCHSRKRGGPCRRAGAQE